MRTSSVIQKEFLKVSAGNAIERVSMAEMCNFLASFPSQLGRLRCRSIDTDRLRLYPAMFARCTAKYYVLYEAHISFNK